MIFKSPPFQLKQLKTSQGNLRSIRNKAIYIYQFTVALQLCKFSVYEYFNYNNLF